MIYCIGKSIKMKSFIFQLLCKATSKYESQTSTKNQLTIDDSTVYPKESFGQNTKEIVWILECAKHIYLQPRALGAIGAINHRTLEVFLSANYDCFAQFSTWFYAKQLKITIKQLIQYKFSTTKLKIY